MVTIPSDNFHHTLCSAKIKFISLSFSFVRQFLTFANSSDGMINRFGTIRTLRMS